MPGYFLTFFFFFTFTTLLQHAPPIHTKKRENERMRRKKREEGEEERKKIENDEKSLFLALICNGIDMKAHIERYADKKESYDEKVFFTREREREIEIGKKKINSFK